jgi:glycosyltransferase involved in cell wall biosynthesis
MLYVDLPTGDCWGWGICGDNLSKALADLVPIERLRHAPPIQPLPDPLLQSVGADLRPHRGPISAVRRVGYVMFEEDVEVQRTALDALRGFDAIAAACRWGEDTLREGGVTEVATVHQGVDVTRFNPRRAVRRHFRNRFVVFSGGKFELRKGQDVVAQAFRIFADRHADALLTAAWHSPSAGGGRSMLASPYRPFTSARGEQFNDALRRWLSGAGIDLRRVNLVPQLPNAELGRFYADSDVGLFPNRCEGATNLVLMEYMACGRAVIATDFSGHRDVLSDVNSFPLRGWRTAKSVRDGAVRGRWCEPNIDEIVECLEQAYSDRERLADMGRRAAADLAEWTWDRAARRFLSLLDVSF